MRLSYFKHARNAMLKSDYHGALRHESALWQNIRELLLRKRGIRTKHLYCKISTIACAFIIPRFPLKITPKPTFVSAYAGNSAIVLTGRVCICICTESLKTVRPCNACMAMLRDFGIEEVYYTTENGYAQERIKGKEDI